MSEGALPAELRDWIQSATAATVTRSNRHLAGASRQAWSVDVLRDGTTIPLFVLRDNLSGNGGSRRDGAVLGALAATSVPVPRVEAADEHLGALLLERVEGRSDFPGVDHEDEREPTARDLMRVTAELHALEPAALPVDHLGTPGDPSDHAATQLAQVEGVATMLPGPPAPLFMFALAWLRRNVPTEVGRTSLVHSDMGPGNFIYRDGRVAAVVDWEVAHWGDGMEDLAAIAVRDMATPVGHLPTRYAEYEAAGGGPVDLARVEWYRVLVLTRNAMLIGLGLTRDDPMLDRAQLTMYRMLLMRAGALALCDALGVARPLEPPLEDGPLLAGWAPEDLALVAHAWRDQRDTVEPALDGAFVGQRARGVSGVLGFIDYRLRFHADYLGRELDDLATVLGRRPVDERDGFDAVRQLCADARRERELAALFARHLLRRGMLVAPLLGPLAERLPQPLSDG